MYGRTCKDGINCGAIILRTMQHSDMVFILGTIKVLNRYLCCMKNASNSLQLAPSKLSSAM